MVVAQGAHAEVRVLADSFVELPLRVIDDDGRGRGRALNVGLRAIGGGVVLITDDDCRVRADWVERGLNEVLSRADTLVTGRVLTHGDLSHVPALRLDPLVHDYVGLSGFGKLAGGNMAARRDDLDTVGGFDERIVPAAEDNDLCWRWLKSGGVVHYEPEMVIWHEDWRDNEQLRAVHRAYGQGQGLFYAKHLGLGDRCIGRFAARDVLAGGRMAIRTLARRRSLGGQANLAFFPALIGTLARTPWLYGSLRSMLTSGPQPAGGQHRLAAEMRNGSVVRVLRSERIPMGYAPRPTTEGFPWVSVVITTKDRCAHVLEAVSSALAQTVQTDVIVMDDHSSDGTREAVLAAFPGVRVETSERSIGCIAQRNRSMDLVTTDLVAMIDDDAYFPSSRTLEQAVLEFDHQRVAVVTIPYMNARRENYLRLQAPANSGAYVAGVFVGVGAVFRRAAFRAVGGYERGLVTRGEEADLGLRLIASGHLIRMARADPLVHWEASLDKDDSAYYYTARNELLLTLLRVPGKFLVVRLFVVTAHATLLGLSKRRLRPVARGLIAGWASAWKRRHERRPIPTWAYVLTRTLRRHGPLPMDDVLDIVCRHTKVR